MKKISLAAAMVALILMSCGGGGSSSSDNVSGNWTAILSTATGATAYVLDLSLSQASDNVSLSKLTVATGDSSCFDGSRLTSGVFTQNGTFNGVAANTLSLVITGAKPGAEGFNTLTMDGAFGGNTVSGSWVLQPGGGCSSQSGNFVMTKS